MTIVQSPFQMVTVPYNLQSNNTSLNNGTIIKQAKWTCIYGIDITHNVIIATHVGKSIWPVFGGSQVRILARAQIFFAAHLYTHGLAMIKAFYVIDMYPPPPPPSD